jgi:Domain of unknown function (DUF3601)
VTIYDLKPHGSYIVRKPFKDYYGNQFSAGERLTYVQKFFLPYDGGHTICFNERRLYLQEEVNAEILDALEDYLALADEVL